MQLTIILLTDEVHNIEVSKNASVAELMIQLKVRLLILYMIGYYYLISNSISQYSLFRIAKLID